MKNIYFAALFAFFATACKNENSPRNTENGLQEVRLDEKVSNKDIIRNPVSASEPLDTLNVAKFAFEETEFMFGKVNQGDLVKHAFKFTNVGKIPLIVTAVQAQCGCTTPEWKHEPIPPGGSSQIDVQFDTKNAINEQAKSVTVAANTYPSQTVLKLRGTVTPK